jgi:hypothetical protein
MLFNIDKLLGKLFWKIPHSVMFNKLTKKNTDSTETEITDSTKTEITDSTKTKIMGEYIIRVKMERANIMSYYKLYNAIPSKYYGSIW